MITVITRATDVYISARQAEGGRTYVKVLFHDQPGHEFPRDYAVPEPFELETDGAIIQPNGWLPFTPFIARWPEIVREGNILWIIDLREFKARFPATATGDHFCIVAGIGTDNERCVSDNCPHPCKMHVYPGIFCSCDG
jgi:hypothetical protein